MGKRTESASETLMFRSWETRMAKLDELIGASHAMLDTSQAQLDEMTRTIFALEKRLDLVEEWARLRFEELVRDR
jgi:hypothetical protein